MTKPAGADAPIGVFDSGIGGLSILRALRTELPGEDFVYFADTRHAPYGERGDDYVADCSRRIVQQLRDEHGIKALVVACNTATAAAIALLRAEHPGLPVIGVEPALKPAAASSQTRRIGVLATRATLASSKFQALHGELKGQADFVLQACDGLADAIERGDPGTVGALCSRYTEALGRFGNASGQIDTLVLGCTHYVFAQQQLADCVGPAVRLVETGIPVARHTRSLLASALLLKPPGAAPAHPVRMLASGPPAALEAAAARWL